MGKIYFNGLSFIVDSGVYKPSDDSFLLAMYGRKARGRILDIGTGCGIGAIAACTGNKENIALGVDISRKAVENAERNAKGNGVEGRCDFLISDLFENVKGRFDVILFNPPYLPAKKNADIALAHDATYPGRRKVNAGENGCIAWDGGLDGRKVIDRFLKEFDEYLKTDGKMIMIDSSLDDTGKTVEKLEEKGFRVRKLEEKRFFFEVLTVIEATKR